jgi:hypothetical protein
VLFDGLDTDAVKACTMKRIGAYTFWNLRNALWLLLAVSALISMAVADFLRNS